jgi:endoglucanase
MPGRMKHVIIGLTLPLVGLLPGCITSPTYEFGPTAEAKTTTLPPCRDGLLDDLEDGDGQAAKVNGRDGYWFTFADTEGSTIEPRGEYKPAAGGANGSKFAGHASGKMAPKGVSLYAGVGFALTNPKTPYDFKAAKGIQFWAKGPGRVRFKTPDINTTPEGDRCSDCYNDFGVDITLQDSWQRYTVPFEKMAQQPGWGDRAPAVDSHHVFAVQWQFSTPNAAYDLWFDDIRLVGCE